MYVQRGKKMTDVNDLTMKIDDYVMNHSIDKELNDILYAIAQILRGIK